MWKQFDKFEKSNGTQREAVETVIQGKANMYTVDAKDISFQVKKDSQSFYHTLQYPTFAHFQLPEIVLREYETLCREGEGGERNSNTYHAGKLNLIW